MSSHNTGTLFALVITGLLINLIATMPLYALEADRKLPITIHADNAEVNQQTGVSIYTGQVELKQGSLRMTASRISLTHGKQGKPLRAIVTGSPATFQQLIENSDIPAQATAQKIDYVAGSATIYLSGNAWLKHLNDELKGDTVSYNLQEGHIVAGRGNSSERVTIIVHPEKDTE